MQLRSTVVALACAAALLASQGDAQTLRGSRSSVDRMYSQARSHALPFYRTPRGVRAAAADGELVRLSGNANYRVAGVTYPYAVATTRTFVQRLAEQYRDYCGEKLVITSAMRPSSFRLFNSVDKSVHPAGIAVDIRIPAKARCKTWLRQRLLHLEGEGVAEATEERRPPHFHVAVFPGPYRRYIGGGTSAERSTRVATPAKRPAAPARASYRVRSGDSLWSIARRHGTTVERLRSANNLRGSTVKPGQTLTIPR
jgi:LysM repeat protein